MAVNQSRRSRRADEAEGPYVPPPGPIIYLLNTAGTGSSYAARLCRKIAYEMMKKLRLEERDVSLSLVTDAQIRKINRDWADNDKHTDVLTFPLHINVGSLGDVIISLDTAKRQAREGGWTLEAELRRLMAHGLLHAIEHTHDGVGDSLKMARAEEDLLGKAGMVGWALTDEHKAKAQYEAQYNAWKKRMAQEKLARNAGGKTPAKKPVAGKGAATKAAAKKKAPAARAKK